MTKTDTKAVSEVAQAAKLIRAELGKAFPGTKFSIRSESFSMGNAVRIGWTDGPAFEAVDAIAQRFTSGSFDGMTDCYNYDSNRSGPTAKYVTCTRRVSDELHAKVLADLRAMFAPNDSADVETIAYRILRRSDLRAPYAGIKSINEFPGFAIVTGEGVPSAPSTPPAAEAVPTAVAEETTDVTLILDQREMPPCLPAADREEAPAYIPTSRPRVTDARPRMAGAGEVWQRMRERCEAARVEEFWTIALDVRHRVIAETMNARGSMTGVEVHPRDVFRQLIADGAAAVILVHNHPSGDPSPSRADVELTRRLRDVGELCGIPVLDHVVIGTDSFVSLADRNWL